LQTDSESAGAVYFWDQAIGNHSDLEGNNSSVLFSYKIYVSRNCNYDACTDAYSN